MGKANVAITLDENIVRHLDYLVGQRAFKNRSQVIQEAVAEKLERLSRGRLARECARLDPVAEQESAEEGPRGGREDLARILNGNRHGDYEPTATNGFPTDSASCF